jgi:pimeloyl-ACP methyl ester carboxylesterase
MQAESRYIDVDGIRTHYLEAGAGPTVVLLHSGEFGACAELSWEFNIDALAAQFRVIAPDWLGFGRTDKLFDFAGSRGRSLRHMQRFFEVMDVSGAAFIGNSMGAGNLLRIAAARPVIFPIRAAIVAGGGGFSPNNEWRQRLLDYDCTADAMREVLKALFDDPKLAADDSYVDRRQEMALLPGAWECTAAARFRSPANKQAEHFGQADETDYESIAVPTLVVAGASDKLRDSGYTNAFVPRIPDCELYLLKACGHCPHIEHPARFNAIAIAFLEKVFW